MDTEIVRLGGRTRMSMTTIHNGTIYLAGLVADDPGSSVRIQTQQVLDKVNSLLSAVGSRKSKLLSATIWITDVEDFDEMNAVWDAWVEPDHLPVRACVEAALVAPGFKVEIMVIAAN